MVLETQYRLAAHKKNENHYLRRKRRKDNGNADKAVVEKKRKKASETITSFFKGINSMKLVVIRKGQQMMLRYGDVNLVMSYGKEMMMMEIGGLYMRVQRKVPSPV